MWDLPNFTVSFFKKWIYLYKTLLTMANYGDGSWELTITVTDLQVERNLRVSGDLHIGGVMVQLVEALGKMWCHNNQFQSEKSSF